MRLQIRRFEEEVKLRRPQGPSQIEDLMRLVIRRPDSEAIFGEAGRRIAERYWHQRASGLRALVRFLPRAIALLFAQRAGKRMFGELVGPSSFTIGRRPESLRIDSPMTCRADPSGAACSLYAGAFLALLELYTGRRYRVLHTSCATSSGEELCEWSVEMRE
ncbi:MAG: hypothetical protein GEU90_03590 [Gemmatimonas sp.]|nr:hypothetical protein [Gemmatimonas sp.]